MIALWFVLGGAVLFVAFTILNSYRYRIKVINMPFSNLPKGFDGIKIFFISDVHTRRISKKLLEKVKKLGPMDLVCIGGDLIEKDVPLERARENLRLLKSFAPVYFVWGNHDLHANPKELDVLFLEEGIKVLNNESVRFETYEGDILWLMGVDDLCHRRDKIEWAYMDTNETEGFRVLLSHSPSIVKKLKAEYKISLILSGHTHGGQVALPWIGPLFGGKGSFFPKHVSGLYDLGETKLYVSNGYGTSHLPVRFFAPPEVVIIVLKSTENN